MSRTDNSTVGTPPKSLGAEPLVSTSKLSLASGSIFSLSDQGSSCEDGHELENSWDQFNFTAFVNIHNIHYASPLQT